MKKAVSIILLIGIVLLLPITVGSYAMGAGIEAMASECELIKTGLLGQKLRFSDSDFKKAHAVSDFKSVTVTSLPQSTEGTLLFAGRRVKEGQTIKRKNLAAVVFVPSSSEVTEASFTYILNGVGTGSETECIMKFIDRVNYTPSVDAEEVSAVTQEEITLHGRMRATDPEGDKLLYMVVSYPKRGRLTEINSETGTYRYVPDEGFTGYDSFVWVARDEYGNYTDTVTVSVKVVGRMSDVVYIDMQDRSEYNAAVAMTAMGIMSGQMVGDDSYFKPDEAVTKAEFVAMAMKARGIRSDSSLKMSFFDDNSEIPASLVGYVATAQRLGIIDGDFTDKGLVFNPNAPITKYEAASVMSRLLGTGEDENTEFSENDTVPIWAMSDVYAMFTLGIFEGDRESVDGGVTLTRADAAEYIYRMEQSA